MRADPDATRQAGSEGAASLLTAATHARRFVHVCYSCAEPEPVIKMLVEALDLDLVMTAPPIRKSGDTLGVDSEIVAGMSFVYDWRGPRVGPGVEVHQWMDPELVGTPPDDPLSVGTQALGFAVRDIARAVERLESFGCVVHSSGQDPFGARWVSVRDSRSVTLDLVEDLPESMERTLMRHLRITCDDLESSVTWYERLGAAVVDRAVVSDGSFLGISAPVDTHLVRLRLPDEGFELLLVGWAGAISRGRHPALVNHAGLYRAAVAADDTRRTYVDLSGEGWEFSRSPKLVVLPGKDVQDMWISFATDPNGIPIEFVQRPRSAFREDPAGIAIENRKLEL